MRRRRRAPKPKALDWTKIEAERAGLLAQVNQVLSQANLEAVAESEANRREIREWTARTYPDLAGEANREGFLRRVRLGTRDQDGRLIWTESLRRRTRQNETESTESASEGATRPPGHVDPSGSHTGQIRAFLEEEEVYEGGSGGFGAEDF